MSITDRLRHNLSLKLVSLVIALVIWGTVHNQANPLVTARQTLRVEAIGVPEGLAVSAIDPQDVNVTLRGRRSALQRLEDLDLHLVANLKAGGIGTVPTQLEPRGLPPGLEISYTQRVAHVTLDAMMTVTRPVLVQGRGEPAPGVEVAGQSVRPATVRVSGPSADARKVVRVLAPVDLAGAGENAVVSVDLLAVDESNLVVSGVVVEPAKATVTLALRRVATRRVPVAPVVGAVPPGYEIAAVVAEPAVVALGAGKGLADVAAIATAPVQPAAKEGVAEYTATLRVPDGISVAGSTSVRVKVTLRKVPAAPTAPPAQVPPGAPPATDGEPPPTPAPAKPPETPEPAVPNP